MNTIWTLFVGLIAIIAAMMALGLLAMFATLPFLWVFIVFWVIILYRLLPKSFGVFGVSLAVIGVCVYFVISFLSIFVCQPMHYLMKTALATVAVLIMLKGKPRWLWGVVALVFIGYGVFYLFYNDIVGPMTFLIMDRPIDTPSQWYNCYRFFWTGVYLDGVIWYSSIISTIIIFIYIMYYRYKDKISFNLL
jgi:hypothetical protein